MESGKALLLSVSLCYRPSPSIVQVFARPIVRKQPAFLIFFLWLGCRESKQHDPWDRMFRMLAPVRLFLFLTTFGILNIIVGLAKAGVIMTRKNTPQR